MNLENKLQVNKKLKNEFKWQEGRCYWLFFLRLIRNQPTCNIGIDNNFHFDNSEIANEVTIDQIITVEFNTFDITWLLNCSIFSLDWKIFYTCFMKVICNCLNDNGFRHYDILMYHELDLAKLIHQRNLSTKDINQTLNNFIPPLFNVY